MNSTIRKVKSAAYTFALLVMCPTAFATDIGAPASGFFAQIGTMLQDFVDFLEGPFGIFVPIVGLAAAVGVWMLGTRGGESLGWIGRVVIGALLILNIPALVIALQAV